MMLLALQDTALTVIIIAVTILLCIGAVFLMRHEQKSYKKDKFLLIDDVVPYTVLYKMVDYRIKAAKKDIYFTLLLLSIDNFDQLSEYIGETGGKEFMESIIRNLHINISKGSKIAIMKNKGEILIYFPELYDEEDLLELASRFKEVVEKKVKVMRNIPLQKSASITLASYPTQGGNLDRLMHCLYAAMFEIKKAGGNKTAIFAPEMDRDGVYVEHYIKLREAIDHGRVALCFNPVFDIAKNRLYCGESVFIWGRDDGTITDYEDLMPYMEESGDELWVGNWALEKAVMANINIFRAENLKEYYVALPVSVKQVDSVESANIYQDALDKFGLAPRNVILDIQKLANASSSARLMKNMLQMQALGFKFMLDVSKVSENSLKLLVDYKIDFIKMDAAAILDKKNKTAVDILNYAEENCKKIIAKDIKNKEQIEALIGKKIIYGEGAYYGANKTKEELLAVL